MRIGLLIGGLVLLVAGVLGLLGKLEYPHDKEVLKIGGLSAGVTQEKTVPQWAGILAIVAGLGLIVAGGRKP